VAGQRPPPPPPAPTVHADGTGDDEESDEIPAFFPPYTSWVSDPIKGLPTVTLDELSRRLGSVLNSLGFEDQKSFYWLTETHLPGFAIITHPEMIDDQGVRFAWGLSLPNNRSLIPDFVRGCPSPGRYRLMAFVVTKNPYQLNPKKGLMTISSAETLAGGPRELSKRQKAGDVLVDDQFSLIIYIYEWARPSRSEPPQALDANSPESASIDVSTRLLCLGQLRKHCWRSGGCWAVS
jgi:hypothetical protein